MGSVCSCGFSDPVPGLLDLYFFDHTVRKNCLKHRSIIFRIIPTLESYKFLIQNVGLLSKIGNTVLIVGITLVISTVLCAMAAYGFSRFNSKGVSVAFAFVLATMLIPEVVTARPLYEFMQKVKLYDTYPGLILLYISTVIPFTVLILRNFVGEIPISLEEAAAIDGASFSQRLFTIVLR